jgi:hypothetical protein
VAAVVGEQGKFMAQCSAANQEIQVADSPLRCPKAASFPAEYFTCFLINTDHDNSPKEIIQVSLVS